VISSCGEYIPITPSFTFNSTAQRHEVQVVAALIQARSVGERKRRPIRFVLRFGAEHE
jgi:hypothetical protein